MPPGRRTAGAAIIPSTGVRRPGRAGAGTYITAMGPPRASADARYLGAWNEINARIAQRQALLTIYTSLALAALGAPLLPEAAGGLWRLCYAAGPLSVLFAQQPQFGLNTRRALQRILPTHTADEAAKLGVDARPSRPAPRFPPPIEVEALATPADDRCRGDDQQGVFPAGPASEQPDPQQAIPMPQVGPPDGAPQDGQLLAQGQVLQDELAVWQQK